MRRMMRFPLSGGGFVVVEVDEDDSGVVRAGSPADTVSDAAASLAEVLAPIRDAADETLRVLRGMSDTPDRIEVGFGVLLTTEANAIIAKAGAQGHLAVTVTWLRQPEATA